MRSLVAKPADGTSPPPDAKPRALAANAMKSFFVFTIFSLLYSSAFPYSLGYSRIDTLVTPLSFSQSIDKETSFWDIDIVNFINAELKTYDRTKFDTVFVFIEEGYSPIIECYIVSKNKSKISVRYIYFMTPEKECYLVDLVSSKFKIRDIWSIYTLVTDPDYLKPIYPDIYFTHERQCHYYFGIGEIDKEVWSMSTSLMRDTNNLMGFLYDSENNPFSSQAKFLNDYFNRIKTNDKVKPPDTIKEYRLRKYGKKKKK